MKLSCCYILKKFEVAVDGSPKQALTDEEFHKIVCLVGGHQKFLNVSRCINLSTSKFSELNLCSSLRFLDLSYTSFNDLTILESCPVLESLALCGIDMPSFRNISRLTSLDLINLSFSSIDSINPFISLVRLRSIDVGHCDIQSIRGIECLTRLEELLLDATFLKGKECVAQSTATLAALPSLRLISIGSTGLMEVVDQLKETLGPRIYVDTIPRRYCDGAWLTIDMVTCVVHSIYFSLSAWLRILTKLISTRRINSDQIAADRRHLWFKAVLSNDTQTVSDLLSRGFDADLRAGPWASGLFVDAWTQGKCRQHTPFFDCTHPDPQLRPRALHLALFFNYRELLALLINARVRDYWLLSVIIGDS